MRWVRFWVAAVGGLLVVGAGAAVALRSRAPRPNVLILLWDTVRADRMTIYGGPATTTPRMADWARRKAVVFERALAPDVWTVPTHASMFTGLPSATHGAGTNHLWLESDHLTLAEVLSAQGFDTYAFSANPNLSTKSMNLLQGFSDVEVSWEGEWEAQSILATRAKLLPRDASTEISPAHPNRVGFGLTSNAGAVAHDAFVRWLDTRSDRDRPWLAYLSYMEAHKPRVPSLRARRRVAPDDVVRTAMATDTSLKQQLLYSYGQKEWSAEELAAIRATYDATLVDLDDATSDLLADLEARGILDDTIVVLVADHGEQLGEHHRIGHRMGLDRALVHVPLVVSWPGHLAPGRESTTVNTAGMFRSILNLLQMDPELPSPVTPDWFAKTQPTEVFSETYGWDEGSFARVTTLFPGLSPEPFARTWHAVRRGPWSLVETRGILSGTVERALYDVDQDPDELHDLALEQPDLVTELAGLLQARDAATPIAPTTHEVAPSSDEERRQLELLGYVEPN